VRPDLDPEEEEAPVGEVQQNRLIGQVRPTVEPDPGRHVVDAQRDDHDDPLEVPERALDPLRKHGLTRGIELLRLFGRTHSGITLGLNRHCSAQAHF
jgi:hypothetical protein